MLVEGRPRTLHGLPDLADAVVHAMVPGPQGGPAIASLLYGEYAPSGRLPITYPKDEGVTVPHWHRVTQACNGAAGGFLAATTEDCAVEWPFGAGLSYAQTELSAAHGAPALHVATAVERTPVVMPDPEDWELEMWELQARLEEFLSLIHI